MSRLRNAEIHCLCIEREIFSQQAYLTIQAVVICQQNVCCYIGF